MSAHGEISIRLETPGNIFSIEGDYIGEVIEALDNDTLKVRLRIDTASRFYPYLGNFAKQEAWINANFEILDVQTLAIEEEEEEEEGDEEDTTSKNTGKKKKEPVKEIWADVMFKVSHSWMTHSTYHWEGFRAAGTETFAI